MITDKAMDKAPDNNQMVEMKKEEKAKTKSLIQQNHPILKLENTKIAIQMMNVLIPMLVHKVKHQPKRE